MRIVTTIALLLALTPALALAQKDPSEGAPQAKVTELFTKAVKENPGKEVELITVDYPPGAIDPIHRHDAYAIVYVLEGNIVMAVKGQPEKTLKPGDSYFEGPDDIHTVGRNASKTKPAKFVVFFLKDQNKPILTPVH
ncbi:cupin domain-containing protein [Luteibacter sp. NPDC031894]|jgi:quercetin dioxygenase-like cupin family protein|uniref:cupin domain-containing protein n=1 Tax=Luteibacter sp. NPDC031894 TaxID=3390572 RepID=UPI003D022D04